MTIQFDEIYFPFQLAKNAKNTCFIVNNKIISNQKFLQDINNIRVNLISLSCQKIALCFENSYLFSVSLFACILSQKIPVLLPNNQSGTINKLSKEYDLILNSESFKNFERNNKKISPAIIKSNQKIMLYTSGSTSEPKLVVRTVKQLILEIEELDNTFYTKEEVKREIYTTVSHQHIYGLLFFILWPLFKQHTIFLPVLEYPEQLENAQPSDDTVMTIVSSPALLKRLDETKRNYQQIIVFSSGGELDNHNADKVGKIFGQHPYEIYGSTETGGIAYRKQSSTSDWKIFNQVNIKPNTKQLTIMSPFFCYNNQYVTTNDQIEYDANNKTLKLIGRMDNIVKIEEKRLSLTEMESLLLKNKFIHDCKVIALSDKRQYVAAIIILNSKGEIFLRNNTKLLLNKELQLYLRGFYDNVLVPKKFRYIDHIPTNSQGKILISDLKAVFGDQV